MGRIATLLLAVALAGAAHAQSAFDLVFRTGTLDGLAAGAELRYRGEGSLGAEAGEAWGRVVVGLGPGGSAEVGVGTGEGADPVRPIGSFDAGVGNPVAMVFLERTVKAISEETGGSPFYIRNRIRDALGAPGRVEEVRVPWDGGTVAATAVLLAPFAADAHRAELGAFADLRITVVVSDAVPGWYHSMRAEAPAAGATPALASSLTLAEAAP